MCSASLSRTILNPASFAGLHSSRRLQYKLSQNFCTWWTDVSGLRIWPPPPHTCCTMTALGVESLGCILQSGLPTRYKTKELCFHSKRYIWTQCDANERWAWKPKMMWLHGHRASVIPDMNINCACIAMHSNRTNAIPRTTISGGQVHEMYCLPCIILRPVWAHLPGFPKWPYSIIAKRFISLTTHAWAQLL